MSTGTKLQLEVKAPELLGEAPSASIERLTRLVRGFVALWHYPFLGQGWGLACVATLALGFCVARACIGLAGTQIFSHDAFMLLDGGWRMLNGQRPHVDFYSHVGLLAYAPTALCLWLLDGRAEAFGYAQALSGLILGAWAYLLSRTRLTQVTTALITIAITLMAVDPAALGFQPLWMAPAMTYNRCGYALLALLLIEALAGSRSPSERADFLGGISTGAVVASLLFLKITYFVAGTFLVLVLIPCRRQTRSRWLGVVTGFSALWIAFCAYLRFDLKPMLRDLRMVAGAKHFSYGGAPHISFSWYMVDGILKDAGMLAIFIVIAALLLLLHGKRRAARSISISAAAICITGLLLILSNYEQNGFPLSVFLAIIVINEIVLSVPAKKSADLLHASVLLVGTGIIAASLGSGMLGLGGGLLDRFVRAPKHERLDAPRLHAFIPMDDDQWYTGYVNNGLELVKRYRLPDETVMSLDFTNPFSYGLGIKPARGGTPVFQYRTTFDDVHKPSPEWLFGSSDLVMYPKSFSDPNLTDTVPYLYRPYLERHFTRIGESPDWLLYRNNASVR